MDMHRQDVQSTKGESYPWIIHHTTHPRKLFLQIVLQKIRNSFCFLRLSIVFTIQILKPYLQLPAVSSLWCPARLPFPTHRAVALSAAITFTSTTIATRPFGTFLSAIPLQKSPFPALSSYVLLVVTWALSMTLKMGVLNATMLCQKKRVTEKSLQLLKMLVTKEKRREKSLTLVCLLIRLNGSLYVV